MIEVDDIRARFRQAAKFLDERGRRLFAANEALAIGYGGVTAAAAATGLARSTIKNEVNRLKKAGRLEPTGEVKGQMEQVRRVDLRTRPIKKKSAKSTSEPTTVAELFASPPPWRAPSRRCWR